MLFNSLHFLVYFPIVVTLYFLLPQRGRWPWLLAASCWFYMAFIPVYLLILVFTIVIDYGAGILIEGASGAARKRYLALSIVANVGVLAMFKYYDFLNNNVAVLFRTLHWAYPMPSLGILLPIGLSFHTFQAMSYTIEVYYGRQPAERHFGIYALYVMFFPQLVAGPIERPQNLLPQFRTHHTFDYVRVTDGLKRMTWGMFKKVCIADRLAAFVNLAYDQPHTHSGLTMVVATVLFAFQIYCDFSGYSDIAIGSAEVMGFRLMENFRRPYFARSIAEFWSRWHISLSTWFRDYVYIPLGGNRVSKVRWYLNIMIVFAVSGLWHGANWTFVVWGVINGIYLIAGGALAPLRGRIVQAATLNRFPVLLRVSRVAMTFGLVCFAWIFFRASTLADALYIIRSMGSGSLTAGADDLIRSVGEVGRINFILTICFVLTLLTVHLLQSRTRIRMAVAELPFVVRWPVYAGSLLAIILFGRFDAPQPFIYFQF